MRKCGDTDAVMRVCRDAGMQRCVVVHANMRRCKDAAVEMQM